MKKYNAILKRVERLIGNKTTFLSQLGNTGKQLLGDKFKGVYPSDKIPKLTLKTPYCILNLDKSNESGSHWISVTLDTHGHTSSVSGVKGARPLVVYDSFGRTNTHIIPSLSKSGNGLLIDTDKDAEQDILELNCGQRSLAFLIFFDKYGCKPSLLI